MNLLQQRGLASEAKKMDSRRQRVPQPPEPAKPESLPEPELRANIRSEVSVEYDTKKHKDLILCF